MKTAECACAASCREASTDEPSCCISWMRGESSPEGGLFSKHEKDPPE